MLMSAGRVLGIYISSVWTEICMCRLLHVQSDVEKLPAAVA